MFSRVFKLFTLLSLLVFVQAAPAPQATTTTIPPTPTTSGCGGALMPRATGPPIKAVTLNTPVTGLELDDAGNVGVLESFGWHTGWSFSSGGLAKFEWSPSCYAYKYLNIGTSTKSYKPLTWSYTKLTSTWSVAYGADIGTIATSISNGSTDFLACQQSNGGWTLYLQTGNDVPAGVTCTSTKLRVL